MTERSPEFDTVGLVKKAQMMRHGISGVSVVGFDAKIQILDYRAESPFNRTDFAGIDVDRICSGAGFMSLVMFTQSLDIQGTLIERFLQVAECSVFCASCFLIKCHLGKTKTPDRHS